MHDGMDRQEYINAILEQIDSKAVKREIEKELTAHIDDREQYYREIGYDGETAAQKAMEHMGSPEAAADGFAKVHEKSRRVTVALTVLTLLSSVLVFLYFWGTIIFVCIDDSVMGFGITEAMFLMYIIGLSVIGKRRNSHFICSVAITDFVIMYVWCVHELFYLEINGFNELCSRIVLKLACLLTGDFDCLSTFYRVGGITVAPYLTYLSIVFYAVIFVLLILVIISVEMLKKPTYGLRTKQFTNGVFKAQKTAWFFIAATMLILPVFGSFNKQAEMTVKTNTNFDTVIIAQSDTPCPFSEIPTDDILIVESNYDWSCYILDWYTYSNNTNIITCSDTEKLEIADYFIGYFIEKECGNKLKYKVAKFDIPCYLTKKYVYIEFATENIFKPPYKNITGETAYEFVSDSSENWYEVDSIGEITAAVDAYNQVEIIIDKVENVIEKSP